MARHPFVPRLSPALAWASLLVLAALAAAAQEPFEDTADVTLVEVPVEVSVGDEPVRGLEAKDFAVYEGRKKRPIVAFEVVDLSRLEAVPGASAAPEAPLPVLLPAAARRHFLFLFDLSNAQPSSILEAQDAALEVIQGGLPSSDLAGVAVYSASRGARLLLGFTSDRAQLELAIRSLGLPELVDRTPDPLGLVLGQARASLLEFSGGLFSSPTGRSGPAGEVSSLRAVAAQYFADELRSDLANQNREQDTNRREQVVALTRSFSDMARLLAQVDARKFVLLFSEGFDSQLVVARGTDENVSQSLESGEVWDVDSDRLFGSTRAQNDLTEMLGEFRRAGAVIHSVDIGRLRGGVDAAEERYGIGAGQVGGGGTPGRLAGSSAGEDSLFMIADGTGGSLYRNFNDLGEALSRVLERSAVTYLLAFEPLENSRDGSYHPIRVEVKGLPAKARVVHRDGFYSNPPLLYQSQLEQRLRMAEILLGGGRGGGVLAALTATALPLQGAPGPGGKPPSSLVPFVVEMEGRGLLAGHGDALLTAEVHLYAFDPAGAVASFQSQMLSFNLLKTRETLEQAGIRFYGDLALPPGTYSLRALVRNQKTGAFGVAQRQVTVGAASPAAAPAAAVFVDGPGLWVMLREKKEELLAPYPFVLGESFLVPVSEPRLEPAGQARLWLQAAALGAGGGEGGGEWQARVTTPDGREVAGGRLELLGREADPGSGGERLLASFEPVGLAAGDYLLHLAQAADSAAGPLAFSVLAEARRR